MAEPEVIRALTEALPGPVNIGRGPQAKPSLTELADLGVARVTFGPSMQRRVYGWFAATILKDLG